VLLGEIRYIEVGVFHGEQDLHSRRIHLLAKIEYPFWGRE